MDTMCLVKRMGWIHHPASGPGTPQSPKPRSKSKLPEDSSLELSTSNPTTSSQLSKDSRESKGSHQSSSSASSLAGIKDMLSDGAIIFQFKDLSKATANFSSSKKVGTSVFRGTVYKTDVAIVVDKKGGSPTDFVAEMKSLCSVHHSNLVKLLGGCLSGDHVYLVYEFISGGNLSQCLRSRFNPGFSALSSWMSRLQVALDVAKGLEYLHHHTHTPTVHKYIKSSNILLDSELHARIAYFGVARIRGETGAGVRVKTIPEETSSGEIVELKEGETSSRRLAHALRRSRSIKITGTHGYMAPEYLNGGLITTKLDVFAFGVILLEILSGKEPVSFQANLSTNSMTKTILPEVIAAIFAERDPRSRVRAWMDSNLRDRFPLDCAYRTAQLARSCVDPDPELRPDMSQVSMILLQIYISSQVWEHKMMASKDLLTSTMVAR